MLKKEKYYSELTGLYWIWKNRIPKLNKDDLIGNCHNRVLWLNNIYTEKQKFSLSNLYSNLLKPSNDIFDKSDVIQVQPIIFKRKSFFTAGEREDFCLIFPLYPIDFPRRFAPDSPAGKRIFRLPGS